MGLFNKKIGVVFAKLDNDAEIFVSKMEELRQKAPSEFQEKIDNQIRIAKYGIMGENNIAFELKNSGMDMYVLHDIYLEVNGLSAQIDYIVITRKRVYIIECKNMFGNIDIDNTGAFVRNYEVNQGGKCNTTSSKRNFFVFPSSKCNDQGVNATNLSKF